MSQASEMRFAGKTVLAPGGGASMTPGRRFHVDLTAEPRFPLM